MRVYCSVLGAASSIKVLNVPRVCTAGDLVSCATEVLRVARTCQLSALSVYIRSEANGKVRYEPFPFKGSGRKAVKDMNVHDRTHLVLDVNNVLKK